MDEIPPQIQSESDQAQRRMALGLGIASIFCCLLGPFALALGMRAHRRMAEKMSLMAILLGAMATSFLVLGLVAASIGLGVYLAGNPQSVTKIYSVLPSASSLLHRIHSRPPRKIEERIQLSADQREFVVAYGWPDSFILNLEPNGKRIEIWQYFQCHSDDYLLREHFKPCRVSFISGKFHNVQAFDTHVKLSPLNYRPTEFVVSLTPDQIQKGFGRPSLSRTPNLPGFGKIEILSYDHEIIFMFRENALWGVVSIAGGS